MNLPSPLMTFLNIYVIDIHHILTFQMLGDTWPAAFLSKLVSGARIPENVKKDIVFCSHDEVWTLVSTTCFLTHSLLISAVQGRHWLSVPHVETSEFSNIL